MPINKQIDFKQEREAFYNDKNTDHKMGKQKIQIARQRLTT